MSSFSKAWVITLIPVLSVLALTWKASDSMPRHVSVGDHRLRVQVSGEGSPAVVFEAFGPTYLEHMGRVQPAVASFTTTVSYDHAGYWGSEPGPKPRNAAQVTSELRLLLQNAGVAPPYILVGFSFGGPYVRVFADRYSEDVAGLVLVDPSQEAFMAWLREEWPTVNRITAEETAEQMEWGCQWDSMNMASNAVMPEVPLTLLTGMRKTDNVFTERVKHRWFASHQAWLAKYPWARHIVTTNSGHAIPLSEPELVVMAIREVYDQAVQTTKQRQ